MRIAAQTPVPVPDEATEPFWEAAGRHVLVMQRCGACGWFAYPPTNFCNNCLVAEPVFTWEPVSGRGRLRTWTIMRQAFLPGFDAELPYAVGDVELVEQRGLRMAARLVDVSHDDLAVDMDLEVVFADLEGGLAIPHFTRASS